MNWSSWSFPTDIRGKVLSGVDLNKEADELQLKFADGTDVTWVADGDCCSISWIEHITVPPDIDGATVCGVADSDKVSEPTQEELDKADSLAVYATAIQTDRGEIIVEYRNDSNGYYGGFLVEKR